MSLGSMLLPTANGRVSGCPQKRNGKKQQGVVSSKRSILGAMNLPKDRADFGQKHSVPLPVGSFPPNGFGLYDCAGSVWEWCHDWYEPDYYAVSPIRNPTGVETGGARVYYVVGLGTTSASKSALRIEVGSVLSLIRTKLWIPLSAELIWNRRFLTQCRQIIPIALKAEIVLPANSLDLPATFWTFCYRGR